MFRVWDASRRKSASREALKCETSAACEYFFSKRTSVCVVASCVNDEIDVRREGIDICGIVEASIGSRHKF